MSLHPAATRWFETYIPREQTVYALEALADTGQVELDRDFIGVPVPETRQLRGTLRAIEELQRRHARLLPPPAVSHQVLEGPPEHTAQLALQTLRLWLAERLRAERRLGAWRTERDNLVLLRECLQAMGEDAAGLADFGQATRFLFKRLYACPLSSSKDVTGPGVCDAKVYRGARYAFCVVVCLPEARDAIDREAAARHCRTIELPAWLAADWGQREARLNERIAELAAHIAQHADASVAAHADPQLHRALQDASLLRWYLAHSVTLTEDHRHCHVTGWTTAADPAVLQRALQQLGVNAVIVFRSAPPGLEPPVQAKHSWWRNPFRVFVDMQGTPGEHEFDPTALLAVIVPVLFGFMFADIGHGLVLAVAGLALSRRQPQLRFLVPCGLAAAGFGVVFSENFGLPGPWPPLWVSPLEQPLLVLLVPLAFGAGVILLGLALSGVEAHWRGELRRWLAVDGAVLVLYVSGLLSLWQPPALLATLLAVLWYVAGLLGGCEQGRARCLVNGLGRLLLSAQELVLHTLSFLRVGAFALAHAALTHSLLQIAELIEGGVPQLLFLVLGHGLVIVVEGLVVFVQTTRLILFEFFLRFLRAEGRLFRPLALPASGSDRT